MYVSDCFDFRLEDICFCKFDKCHTLLMWERTAIRTSFVNVSDEDLKLSGFYC